MNIRLVLQIFYPLGYDPLQVPIKEIMIFKANPILNEAENERILPCRLYINLIDPS